jgi:CDP-diacylglycerol---glycerol-3-phosphate 3-phosphatidyltransferase
MLYQTPYLRGLTRSILRSPFDEGVGVQHMKAFVFDDDVIVTG